MTSTKTRLLLEEEADRLEKNFSATGDKRFLEAARLLRKGLKGRGRPAEPDDPLLYRIARLLRDGTVKSVWAAATRVAKEAGGHSLNATAMRLNRKFKESGESYSWTLQTYEFRRYTDGVCRTWELMIEQFEKARASTQPALQQMENFQAKMQEQLRRSGILAMDEQLAERAAPMARMIEQIERDSPLTKFARFKFNARRS